ncbi:hypothetical protein BpHYR1_005638 [Brachionus plicatilis]|uniref:Uncharacterized protein n=1 Tax=Brachionus plicatilis TaxID=10195 RepID=A0A3M7RZS0_BRAPC|nr:hypothetical protein BpHYR1_005638 [Brachionus plicatilis]
MKCKSFLYSSIKFLDVLDILASNISASRYTFLQIESFKQTYGVVCQSLNSEGPKRVLVVKYQIKIRNQLEREGNFLYGYCYLPLIFECI